MRLLRVLLAVAAVGVVVAAFRDSRTQRWLRPATPFGGEDDGDEEYGGRTRLDVEEPVLGYDGMDRDTLVDWLAESDLDQATLLRIHAYESANLARGSVLDTIDDLLG